MLKPQYVYRIPRGVKDTTHPQKRKTKRDHDYRCMSFSFDKGFSHLVWWSNELYFSQQLLCWIRIRIPKANLDPDSDVKIAFKLCRKYCKGQWEEPSQPPLPANTSGTATYFFFWASFSLVPAVQRQGTGFFKIISYHKWLSLRP